ncbi:MAG TPA: hemerythrin domain-containing protein [Casimicrobiaceae bacterium]|nr:hemerythrin domain-containing protein [Casimicrobiaceae bacterium]
MKDDHFALSPADGLPVAPVARAPVGNDIRALLHDDHQHVMTLSRDLAEAQTAAARRALYTELRTLIDAHSRAEEAVVYDAMLRIEGDGAKDARALCREGMLEHAQLDELLVRLSRTDFASSDAWQAQATVLRRLLERHIGDEEDECFLALDEHFTAAQRRAMAQAFAQMRAPTPRVAFVVS